MNVSEILDGKRVLIVDDEADIIDTLSELLDMCLIDTASDFATAEKFLTEKSYDAAIFDIMGVNGYRLLKISKQKGTPALMLTAHALTPQNLKKSIMDGANAYIPKEKLIEIDIYLSEVLKIKEKKINKHGSWFLRLQSFFDKKFGDSWKEKDREFWKEYKKQYVLTNEELSDILTSTRDELSDIF
jgi:CheY-like chemotaxis protein